MAESNDIVTTEVNRQSIRIKLENGVEIHLSSNKNYLNLSFSWIDYDEGIKIPPVHATNSLNLTYKPAQS